MNKLELSQRIAAVMRERNCKKRIQLPPQKFFISNDSGVTKEFSVKGESKDFLYKVEDINRMLDIATDVIIEAIREGESVRIKTLGTLHLHFRKERTCPDIINGVTSSGLEGRTVIPAHYVVKFDPAPELKRAAKLFEIDPEDRDHLVKPAPSYEDFEEDDE